MINEKLKSLLKYQQHVRDRLLAPTPDKHKAHPHSLKQYLEREMTTVTAKIESMKLEGMK